MKYAVSTENLTKEYKTTLAVDSININVPEGSCCGFLGKNGAGKTTTIKMLVGLNKPTSGNITLMGEKQVYGKQISGKFGYLPDVPNFYGYMTGAEFLDLCAKMCDIPKNEREYRIKSLLKKVGLDKTRAKISGYSRGMKQRLGIAQAMIHNPPVIFMDEPISALDPIGRRDVAEIIQSLKGTTVILSTHILADVEHICDYALIIEKGKILEQDYITGLKQKYSENAANVKFLNESDTKVFAAKAKESGLKAEIINPVEVVLRTEKKENLSKISAAIIHGNGLSFESFNAHSPTLEDIFYELITKTKGGAN